MEGGIWTIWRALGDILEHRLVSHPLRPENGSGITMRNTVSGSPAASPKTVPVVAYDVADGQDIQVIVFLG